MIWKVLGVGLEDEGTATLEAFKLSTGAYVRESLDDGEGALANVSPATKEARYIRIRVILPERKEPFEMRVLIDELRDPEIDTLMARPDNIKGFIEQARFRLAQVSEQPQ